MSIKLKNKHNNIIFTFHCWKLSSIRKKTEVSTYKYYSSRTSISLKSREIKFFGLVEVFDLLRVYEYVILGWIRKGNGIPFNLYLLRFSTYRRFTV